MNPTLQPSTPSLLPRYSPLLITPRSYKNQPSSSQTPPSKRNPSHPNTLNLKTHDSKHPIRSSGK